MKRGKRKRGRYPFQKIVHFFYICYVSRLLHGVCRYLKVYLPRGEGGEGIVRSFIFLPFLILHPHARPGMFLISVVKNHEHLISSFISDLLASLKISLCEIVAAPGVRGRRYMGDEVSTICHHPSPPSSSSSLSFAFSSRSFALRTSRSCSASRRSRALRSRRSQPPGSPRFSEVMECGC